MERSLKIPNINFRLKDDLDQNNEALIFAVLYYNKRRFKYSTGYKVPAKYWNAKSGKVKNVNASSNYTDINDELNDISKKIIDTYKITGYGSISSKLFRDELNAVFGKVKIKQAATKRNFIQFVEDYIQQRKESPKGRRGTWKTWNNTLNILKDYCKAKGFYDPKSEAYTFDFENITWDFRVEFENYLYNVKDHSINYAAKVIQVFTQFLNEANRREICKEIRIHKKGNWHIKKLKTQNFRLTFDELESIYAAKDLNDDQQAAADLFLIGAYSGLRYSDFSRLKPEYVIEDDGDKYLSVRTQKTNQDIIIPIYPLLESLLMKYDFAPPKMSDQKLNVLIKEVAKEAKINKTFIQHTSNGGILKESVVNVNDKISSHCARRSFASNFYELGIPAIMLMKITGHTTEKQFFNYICIDSMYNAKELYKEISSKFKGRHLKAV